MRLYLAIALALCLAGCPHTPPPPFGADAGPVPSSDAVCIHLAIVCGIDADACRHKVDQVAADRLTIFPLACWNVAPTREAVNACGQISCGGPLP